MTLRIDHYLFGFCEVQAELEHPERLLDSLIAARVRFWRIELCERTVRVRVRLCDLRRVEATLEEARARLCAVCRIRTRGLPRHLWRYRARIGLLFGILCSVFLLSLSTFFIWGVTIETDSVHFSRAQLDTMLRDVGVYAGAPRAEVEKSDAAFQFLKRYPEFVFAAFNVRGTTVFAELVERTPRPDAQDARGPCHLTASAGGIILSCTAQNGELMVREGDVVDEGALLVSGAMTLRAGGYRLVQSQGKIMAQTVREFSCFLPYSREQTVFTGEETRTSVWSMLSLRLSPFSAERSVYESERRFVERRALTLFGAALPITVEECVHAQTVVQTVHYTDEQCRRQCYDAYRTWLLDLLGEDGSLIDEQLEYRSQADGVCLTALVSCAENIARSTPFSASFPEAETEDVTS